MKNLLTSIMFLITFSSYATVDVQGESTIVVESYHGEGYFLRTVPTDYCVGISSLTLAATITQPVMIKSNYGCGAQTLDTQVNAATCAIIEAEEVSKAEQNFSQISVKIKKDLSECGEKAHDDQFINTLDQAIYNTYNANGYQVLSIQ